MKRMMKKLAALALAGAMTLSLGVSALASEPEEITYDDVGGVVESTGSIEGIREEDVILVTVPTVSSLTPFTNAILDPYNLIQRSGGHAYTGKALHEEDAVNPFKSSVTKTVNGTPTTEYFSHLLYFKNATVTTDAEGNETTDITYSGTSDEITITNKSDHAIKVALKLEPTAGFEDFKMLNKTSMNAAVADLEAATKPSMFMALVQDGTRVEPVLDSTQVAPHVTVTDKNGYVISAEVEKATLPAGVDADEFAAALKALNKDAGKITFTVAATKASGNNGQALYDQAVTITPAVDVALTGWTSAANTAEPLYDWDSTSSKATAANPEVSIDIKKAINSTPTTIATLKVKFDTAKVIAAIDKAVTADATAAGATLTDAAYGLKIVLSGNDGSATINSSLNWVEDAYELLQVKTGDGVNNVYRNQMLDAYKTGDKKDDFESISFQLMGAITDNTKWEDEDASLLESLTYTLTWEIDKCTSMGPSARATTPLARQAATGVIKYSLGLGDLAAVELVPEDTKYYAENDASNSGTLTELTVTHDADAQTITFNSSRGVDVHSGGYGVVQLKFKYADNTTTTVDVKVV